MTDDLVQMGVTRSPGHSFGCRGRRATASVVPSGVSGLGSAVVPGWATTGQSGADDRVQDGSTDVGSEPGSGPADVPRSCGQTPERPRSGVEVGARLHDDALGLEDAAALFDAAVQLDLCVVDELRVERDGGRARVAVVRLDVGVELGA